MRKGTRFTGYVVIAMFAMVHMMLIGCNSETSGSASSGQMNGVSSSSESLSDFSPKGSVPEDVGEPPLLSIKANGTTVDVQSARIEGNVIRVGYTYQSSTGLLVTRHLDLSNSLLLMTVYDEHGVAILGHEFELLADSSASYRVWSGRDKLMLKATETDDIVNITLSDGTRSTSISGTDETWAAKQGAILSDVFGEYSAFAADNEDLATAEYLIGDEVFTKYLFSEFGDDMAAPLHRAKLCGLASLLCTICNWLWECPPCWIVCVPVCSIALACAIADLFSVGGIQ